MTGSRLVFLAITLFLCAALYGAFRTGEMWPAVVYAIGIIAGVSLLRATEE